MSKYAVFFDYNNKTYRLPVNPESIEISSTQALEKYEILKLGQISVPTHMELKEYTFETEFPKYSKNHFPHYSEMPDKNNEHHGANYYLSFFEWIRNKLVPVRFIAGMFTDNDNDSEVDESEIDLNKCINSLVLIEEMTITENAGEEGDKYVKFKLLEYQEYGAKTATELKITTSTSSGTNATKMKSGSTVKVNKKSTGYYVVKSGDSLWSIAKTYYGAGTKANIIYNANTDKIKNPAVLTIGWKLKIPTENEFSKYSAALPTTKKASDTSSSTSYDQGVAGIATLLD